MSQKTAKRLRRLETQQQHQLEMYIKVVNHMAQMQYQLDSLDTLSPSRDKGSKGKGFAFKCKQCRTVEYTCRRWLLRCHVCGKLHLWCRR